MKLLHDPGTDGSKMDEKDVKKKLRRSRRRGKGLLISSSPSSVPGTDMASAYFIAHHVKETRGSGHQAQSVATANYSVKRVGKGDLTIAKVRPIQYADREHSATLL
jgi:hypothetical protein